MIGYAGTFAIPGGRGRATLRCVQSIERIDAQLGRRLGINSAWRDPIEQERLYTAYRNYVNGNGPWAPIALPPEQSVHCKGEAIDTDDNNAAMTRVLNNNGWFHTVFRNGQLVEPWHYEYNQSKDKFFGGTPASNDYEKFKGFLMSLSDAQQKEIYDNICGGNQRALARVYAQEILNYNMKRGGAGMSGDTNLGGMTTWFDYAMKGINDKIQKSVDEAAHAIAQHVTKTVNNAMAAQNTAPKA